MRDGQTKWVLADKGQAYIVYSYEASENLGLKSLTSGLYRLRWFDCVSGRIEEVKQVRVPGGNSIWRKPSGFGNELALYVSKN